MDPAAADVSFPDVGVEWAGAESISTAARTADPRADVFWTDEETMRRLLHPSEWDLYGD